MPEPVQWKNSDLAAVFDRIAALLEIKGEVVFKIRAYQRAAESLRTLAEDINTVAAEQRLDEIPGVGKAITEKIQELLTTGRLGFLERLENEVPPSLLELLQVPDVGPKKTALFWKELGVTDLAGLADAAKAGRLHGLPGLGEKSEARIVAGIEALTRRTERMLLPKAWEQANRWLAWLREQPGVLRAEVGGSLRRWRETIGDLDLVAACSADSPVMEHFIHHPEVVRVVGQGANKSSIELAQGLRIQLWIAPPERFGSLWLYATGSKAHNVRMRELALKRKLSLSDRGLLKEDETLLTYADEESLYAALGLDWVAPELREDRGEIEAALSQRLPHLIEPGDLKADLHCHSVWSDGQGTILQLARQAQALGLSALAITDHADYPGLVRGITAEKIAAQRADLQAAQREVGDGFRLLHGIEVDIRDDGSLTLPDDVLADLDVVVASLHTHLGLSRVENTRRVVSAMHNPHVDIIAHPTGRFLNDHPGAELDWDTLFAEAKTTGVALEINANPGRLDLTDVYARRAAELGIPLTIDTDTHLLDQMSRGPFGVSVARRAWIEARQVLNTWPVEELLRWLERGA
jgi:DNA polymerase (family 10)